MVAEDQSAQGHGALIVRSVLVTALNLDLGPHMRMARQPSETSGSGGSAEPSYSCAQGCDVRNGEQGPERLTWGSRRGARIQHGAGVISESVTKVNAVMVLALLITEL